MFASLNQCGHHGAKMYCYDWVEMIVKGQRHATTTFKLSVKIAVMRQVLTVVMRQGNYQRDMVYFIVWLWTRRTFKEFSRPDRDDVPWALDNRALHVSTNSYDNAHFKPNLIWLYFWTIPKRFNIVLIPYSNI